MMNDERQWSQFDLTKEQSREYWEALSDEDVKKILDHIRENGLDIPTDALSTDSDVDNPDMTASHATNVSATATPSTGTTIQDNTATNVHLIATLESVTTDDFLNQGIKSITVDGIIRFKCGCGKDFSRKNIVRDHIRSLHLGEYGYFCWTCDTPFRRKADADRHAQTSSRGPAFKCGNPRCTKAFTRSYNRDRHQNERCQFKPALEGT